MEKYGAYAVLGRPLRARELKGGNLAESVVRAALNMGKSENFIVWKQQNPELAKLYEFAEAARMETDD